MSAGFVQGSAANRPPATDLGCPGAVIEKGSKRGKTVPLCFTCGRPSGNDLEPAAVIRGGTAECLNFCSAAVGVAA